MNSLDVKFLFRRHTTVSIIEDDALNSTRVGTGCRGCHDGDDDRQECTNTQCRGVGHCDGGRADGFDWRGVLSVDHRFNTGCCMQ